MLAFGVQSTLVCSRLVLIRTVARVFSAAFNACWRHGITCDRRRPAAPVHPGSADANILAECPATTRGEFSPRSGRASEVTAPPPSDVPETTDFISPPPFGWATSAAIVNLLTDNQIQPAVRHSPFGN
jgi:hypothetical protein